MNTFNTSDRALVDSILAGGNARQHAIRVIYDRQELRSKVAMFVRTHGGNPDDGKDIFHEGIIVLDQNIRNRKYREESGVEGYLYSICRFLWMNRARKTNRILLTGQLPNEQEPSPETPETSFVDEERKALLRKVLDSLGGRCSHILELWRTGHSMEEIASELGLANEAMARKAKYRCHLSLMELLEKHPHVTELLKSFTT